MPDTAAMDWWQAIILGLVEGLTEYLPVSSTGHLILAQQAMGLTGTAANAYAICIQAGAILAVLGLYWRRVRQGFVGLFGKLGLGAGDADGWRLTVNIVVGFLPAAVVGLLADDWIESNLFGLWPIVCAWLVGGVAILLVGRFRRARGEATEADPNPDAPASRGAGLDDMTWRMALGIGLIQCAAMWPGTSRSLVTIVGGVLVGMSLVAAVEFSFLLGVLTLCAATVYKAIENGPIMLEAYGWTAMLIGSVAAWASAAAAMAWMVAYLKKHGLGIFGWYRIALAIVVAALLIGGVFEPAI